MGRDSDATLARLGCHACATRMPRLFTKPVRTGKMPSLALAGRGLNMNETAMDLERFDRRHRLEIPECLDQVPFEISNPFRPAAAESVQIFDAQGVKIGVASNKAV